MRSLSASALLFVLVFCSQALAANTAADCQKDLNYLPGFLLENDAGAQDHLARLGRELLDEAFEQAQALAASASSERECNEALSDYLFSWRTGHIGIQAIDPDTADRSISVGDSERDFQPNIEFLSADTVLLEVSSFHPRAGQALQLALLKLHDELASRTNWIIDVRRNHGGSDSAYQPLLPWLLEDDIVEVQLAFLATEANVKSTLEACELYAPGDKSCVEFMKPIAATMQLARPGSYVALNDHQVEFIQIPESTYPQPTRVAVLMGESCISSCEQFLLTARQSFSVKLIGRSSHGNLDYSNLRPHLLPSGKRQLLYATSRSYRLPEMPVDVTGVMPDIYLPAPHTLEAWEDEVHRVQNWLEGGSLKTMSTE